MALPDPQSITLSAAVSLPRVQTDPMASMYMAADKTAQLQVRQATPKNRRRTYLQLSRRKISTDVLTDVKSYISASISVSIDRPEVGFTESELIELVTGITTWLTESANAKSKRVLGLES